MTPNASKPSSPATSADDTISKWHVMTHLEVGQFRKWFDLVNAERFRNNEPLIRPFYPYEFLRGRLNDTPDVTPNVHRVFRSFVFLKATEADVNELVYSAANLQSHVRLRRYLTPSGKQAFVRDDMMEEFLQACIAYRDRFELAPSNDDIAVMDKVKIKNGIYSGYEATVIRAKLHKGQLFLDLAIPMVSGQINVHMNGVSARDVKPLNPIGINALRADFIRYIQSQVLDILTRRAAQLEQAERERKQAAAERRSLAATLTLTERQKVELQPFLEDSDMLERLLRYRSYEVTNRSANAHFQALMLICAHLCKDTRTEQSLLTTVRTLLSTSSLNPQPSSLTLSSDTDAYLCIALKVATDDPAYRDAVKEYIRARQPKSRHLLAFASLIRKSIRY
ncbi:MAG: hypothetical protein IJQ59_04960 [Bacteroidaceae bacterium]|nr:hypothetical protein [Bacteroidaceae bacterium]